ncbi:hypothetical protein RRG08_002716 [Elysia crispata]|uniref:Uncharacterized protein n=1 Tax=Elysia crispata TaxID=231223 RepID=A0AAE0XUU8_9GAST|nr:hypothetical protein RRG08_002716 [Elysia crispata]
MSTINDAAAFVLKTEKKGKEKELLLAAMWRSMRPGVERLREAEKSRALVSRVPRKHEMLGDGRRQNGPLPGCSETHVTTRLSGCERVDRQEEGSR